jgi:hypothetical protein
MPTRWDLDAFLKERRLETYTAGDFEHDLETIRQIEQARKTVVADGGPLRYLVLIGAVPDALNLACAYSRPRRIAAITRGLRLSCMTAIILRGVLFGA